MEKYDLYISGNGEEPHFTRELSDRVPVAGETVEIGGNRFRVHDVTYSENPRPIVTAFRLSDKDARK